MLSTLKKKKIVVIFPFLDPINLIRPADILGVVIIILRLFYYPVAIYIRMFKLADKKVKQRNGSQLVEDKAI